MLKDDVRTKGFYKRMPVDKALKILLDRVPIGDTEGVTLDMALERVLADDIVADCDIPPFDRAAMDGYAVKGENTFGASPTNPIYFKVIDEIRTGIPSNIRIKEFEAVKIMTGGVLPKGANAVVMFEHANALGDNLEVLKAVTPGNNVSMKGEDVRKGQLLLNKGTILTAHDTGMLAAIGRALVNVYKKPEVAIISTGDELTPPGKKLREGKIYDANTYSLSSLVKMNGGIAKRVGIVKDEYSVLKRALADALKKDMVIVSGATSVGEKDIVPKIVAEMGETLAHGIAMRPGEPTGFGVIKEKPVFMLSGYPVASIVGFETFVRPALQKMQGMEIKSPYPTIKAILNRKIASELGRRDFTRVKLEKKGNKLFAEPIRTKGSGVISSLIRADGFVVVPENTEGLEKGKEVVVNLIRPLQASLK